MTELEKILSPALKTHTLMDIARMAGVNYSHLCDVRRGRSAATAKFLDRVAYAVRRLNYRGPDVKLERPAIYRVVLAMCAGALGLDPLMVLESDPGDKRAANKEWRDASMARWLAQYLLNTRLDMPQARVAHASGVTKQAVSLAMGKVEDMRDNPEFDALLTKLELVLRREEPANAQ